MEFSAVMAALLPSDGNCASNCQLLSPTGQRKRGEETGKRGNIVSLLVHGSGSKGDGLFK